MTQELKLKHSPTLNTILMVEEALKSSSNSIMTIAELRRKLPKQVNHITVRRILEYLEQSNKIVVSMKGITWIHNQDPKMKELLRKAFSYPEDFSK